MSTRNKQPIKTKVPMSGIGQIMDVSLLVCGLLVVYGAIKWDDLAVAIQTCMLDFITFLESLFM